MPATLDDVLAEDQRRAEEVYDRVIRPALRPEIDADDYSAIRRLKARRPGARLWLMRTGPQAACRIRGVSAGRLQLFERTITLLGG